MLSATLPYRILLIEDDREHQLLAETILTPYIVEPGALWMAFDLAGARGIFEARGTDIDVIVTDLGIPESVWCAEGKTQCCAGGLMDLIHYPAPVIACSGTSSPGLCCLALGIEDFLNKKDIRQLPIRIHAAVERFRARLLAFRSMQERFGNGWEI